MPTRPLDIINCTPRGILSPDGHYEEHLQWHCCKRFARMYALYNNTYQLECWKHSHPTRLRAVDNKAKARLHLKYIDLGIMLWPSRLGKSLCGPPTFGLLRWWRIFSIIQREVIPNYGGDGHISWFTRSYIMIHKGWNRSWSSTLLTMKQQQCNPNMSYLGYCTCSDVKCFSRIWSPHNGLHFWNPWSR